MLDLTLTKVVGTSDEALIPERAVHVDPQNPGISWLKYFLTMFLNNNIVQIDIKTSLSINKTWHQSGCKIQRIQNIFTLKLCFFPCNLFGTL